MRRIGNLRISSLLHSFPIDLVASVTASVRHIKKYKNNSSLLQVLCTSSEANKSSFQVRCAAGIKYYKLTILVLVKT